MGSLHRKLIYPTVLRLRGERSMYRALAELRELEYRPTSDLVERQQVKLASVLAYARHHSRYYRDIPNSDVQEVVRALRAFPCLTKTDLQQDFEAIRACPAPARVHSKTTGGSTGEPVTVLKDASAIARERAATWLAYGWFGLRIGDRGARFWGSPTELGWRRLRFAFADIAMNRIRLSAFGVDDDRLMEYWQRCLSFRPLYLYGYTSLLERFARFLQQRELDGLRLGIRCVISTSEALMAPQRKLLQTVFGAPVQNEYGCGEVGPIAYECERESLHVMSENVYVELLDDEENEVAVGDEGSIVVTDLNNRAMPLIRYRLEDRAVRGTGCDCGRGFPVLGKVRGREYDFVVTPDGRSFHGEFFMYIFEDMRAAGLPIRSFRIVQTEVTELKIEVQASDEQETIRATVREKIADGLGITPEVHVVPNLELSQSGKLRIIQSRLQDGSEN